MLSIIYKAKATHFMFIVFMFVCSLKHCFALKRRQLLQLKKTRHEQDSNLRGETPLDFKSNALTTRPS